MVEMECAAELFYLFSLNFSVSGPTAAATPDAVSHKWQQFDIGRRPAVRLKWLLLGQSAQIIGIDWCWCCCVFFLCLVESSAPVQRSADQQCD